MSEENVMIGDTELSLAELAGVDLSDVKEVRSNVIPAGKFMWRIKDAKLEAREVKKDYNDPDSEMINVPFVAFELEAQNCFALVDEELDIDDYIGVTKFHSFKIKDLKKDLGKVKAFLVDIGLEGNKSISALIDEAHGMEFVSDITNRTNRDNPDFIFSNIENVITLEEFAESQAE